MYKEHCITKLSTKTSYQPPQYDNMSSSLIFLNNALDIISYD